MRKRRFMLKMPIKSKKKRERRRSTCTKNKNELTDFISYLFNFIKGKKVKQ